MTEERGGQGRGEVRRGRAEGEAGRTGGGEVETDIGRRSQEEWRL